MQNSRSSDLIAAGVVAVSILAAQPARSQTLAGLAPATQPKLSATLAASSDLPALAALSPQPQPQSEVRELRAQNVQKGVQAPTADSQVTSAATAPSEPFVWGDFTWINGGSRQATHLIDSQYFTPQLDIDLNYTYSFNHPLDNTIVGSTATARHNELQLAFLGFGGDAHIGSVRARLLLQYGTRSTAVPRNDLTSNRGQFDLLTIYRYRGRGIRWLSLQQAERHQRGCGSVFFLYRPIFLHAV